MVPRAILLLCCCAAVACGSQIAVNFSLVEPSLQVKLDGSAELNCCYTTTQGSVQARWIVFSPNSSTHSRVNLDTRVTVFNSQENCFTLKLINVRLNDTGLYCCLLNHTKMFISPGTFLQVYKPIEKIINISESAKNRILVAEGIMLLLCLMVPGTILIGKTRRESELQKKKSNIEEENIYEGLNLDDCNSAYHQIQRSQVQCTYQDVGNVGDYDVQLEKP
ncbi:B-cell antigen receptor complex-associated protein alpha chain [Scleropages formosus]|uniref:B-cell antigen receptor complex-associated protein alpha chain n=1 Tax=Scleropages formosus TaxID=113540 RepID=UPI000878D6B2|nr:B-cell antigen receptor complex-associated protein alpha chain [Scleropages formosus]